MHRWSHLVLGPALALALAACSKEEPKPAAPKPVAATSAETGPRALALAATDASAPVDKLLREEQAAARANPTKPELWIVVGRTWVRKARETADPGFYLNAQACADVALSSSPDDRLALDLRGQVMLNMHAFEGARALAEKVLAKSPDDVIAYGNLSDALLELGRYEEAAAAAQSMLDLKPSLPSYIRASYLAWLRGDVAQAKESARLAIDSAGDARDPEPRAWAITQAAMIFFHEGDYDGAAAGFDKALAWMTDYPPALVGKARVALGRGEALHAAELLGKAYKESPLVETAGLLADARELAGDAKGAAEALAMAEREGRANDPRSLSIVYSTRDRKAKEALELAEKERKVRGDVATDDAYAWALYRNRRFDEARTAIDHARRLGTPDPRLMFHQGAIHIATGDGENGRRLVEAALKTGPRFDVIEAKEAQALAAEPKLSSR